MSIESLRQQLNIAPICPEKVFQVSEDLKEYWAPKWHCFCCLDKGYVANHLVEIVVEEPEENVFYVCRAYKGCVDRIPPSWRSNTIDCITRDNCLKLDAFNRSQWKQWQAEDWEVRKQKQEIVEDFTKNL